MAKWINFIQQPSTGSTKIVKVFSKDGNADLGTIKWYNSWRCYTFQPNQETIFEKDCLQDITDYIKMLMEERKKIKESADLMKHLKLFEEFNSTCKATQEELDLLQKLVDKYTEDKQLDLEEETSLYAICKKLNIDPKSIKQLVPFLKTKTHYDVTIEEGHVVSVRTEEFITKLLCKYIENHDPTEEEKIQELLGKLDMNYEDVKRTCRK